MLGNLNDIILVTFVDPVTVSEIAVLAQYGNGVEHHHSQTKQLLVIHAILKSTMFEKWQSDINDKQHKYTHMRRVNVRERCYKGFLANQAGLH